MLGFLKKFFDKEPAPGAPSPPSARPLPQETPKPASPQKPAVPAKPAARPTGETINLPIDLILKNLPPELKSQTKSGGRKEIVIPLEIITDQLPRGRVRISLAELRSSAPEIFNGMRIDDANAQVDIPLPDILPRLKPGSLARRSDQKTLTVSEEIIPLFGPNGESTAPPAPEARSTPPQKPAPSVAAPARPATAAPATPAIPPAAPTATPTAHPAPTPPPRVAPTPKISQAAPVEPAAIPFQAPTPSAPAVGAQPASGVLSLAVNAASSSWPAALRDQFAAPRAKDLTLEIPRTEVEPGVKRGKIQFPWAKIRDWIKPAPPAIETPVAPETLLELPLALIVPQFMAKQQPFRQQKQFVLDEKIPALFSSSGTPLSGNAAAAAPASSAATAVSAPASPKPRPEPALKQVAPIPMPSAPSAPSVAPSVPPSTAPRPAQPAVAAAPVSGPAPVGPKPILDFGEIFGQPAKRDWTPKEIVTETARFKGVAGALLATPDGLLVTAQLPGEIQADMLAAFVPQLFTRMVQCAKELKFRAPAHCLFHLENLPLQIFQAGRLYFVVLGKAGEALPKIQLGAIAAQLERKSSG